MSEVWNSVKNELLREAALLSPTFYCIIGTSHPINTSCVIESGVGVVTFLDQNGHFAFLQYTWIQLKHQKVKCCLSDEFGRVSEPHNSTKPTYFEVKQFHLSIFKLSKQAQVGQTFKIMAFQNASREQNGQTIWSKMVEKVEVLKSV